MYKIAIACAASLVLSACGSQDEPEQTADATKKVGIPG